jgi:hypothetical protein
LSIDSCSIWVNIHIFGGVLKADFSLHTFLLLTLLLIHTRSGSAWRWGLFMLGHGTAHGMALLGLFPCEQEFKFLYRSDSLRLL